jgi:hypothetical protein
MAGADFSSNKARGGGFAEHTVLSLQEGREKKREDQNVKKWIAMGALLLPLAVAGCAHPRPVAVYTAPPPPGEFSEIARQGFHDGFEAARGDVARNVRPNAERHPNFRNPPVPPPAVQDYRHGFRAGYQSFLERTGPPPGY